MVQYTLHMHVSVYNYLEFPGRNSFLGRENVRPEKFQFLEKGQNRNFDYKIVI